MKNELKTQTKKINPDADYIRQLSQYAAFRTLHEQWTKRIEQIIDEYRNDYRLSIMIRDYTRKMINKMLEYDSTRTAKQN